MLALYETWNQQDLDLEEDPEFAKNNLSYDLCTTDWILAKVRNSTAYAQNLYAAMCNNSFQKMDTWTILKNETWACSWRCAGGIVADMRQEGDYIDWYCSGIRHDDGDLTSTYVNESVVTEEIEQDLMKLGWKVIQDDDKPV